MNYSKHNILSRIFNSNEYILVNPLSGNADIISGEIAERINQNILPENSGELVEKGYIVDPEKEKAAFREGYLDFLDSRNEEEIQIFFVPWYTCNFNCSYCYQDQYDAPIQKVNHEIIDAFFRYVEGNFASRRKYITLFGGEPLLNGTVNREFVSYFLEKCNEFSLDVAIVTNGYNLTEYQDILKKTNIREIQVTLDGTQAVHDARRHLKDGSGTFTSIAAGISASLENGFPVNLRMVTDKENIDNLPELARFAIQAGWTSSPLFKTQIGRNYELHHCQTERSRLYGRLELYKDLYRLAENFPEVTEFHKPAFSISQFLFDNGEMPPPLYDACPGTKSEWAFDYTGSIYSCTATVGKQDEKLGTFWPEISLDEDRVDEWSGRDVLAVKECHDCKLQLICGAGCGSIAKNASGKLYSTDCRPIDDLIGLGVAHYFKNELSENS